MPIPVSQISMRDFALPRTAPDQHLAAMSIFERVRDQIADHLLEQTPIALNGQRAGDHAQREAGRLRMIGQFIPQAIKQFIHADRDDFGLNGAHFNLVDVEERIQHPGHGVQSFVDASDQFLRLRPDHILGEQALKQGKRLQWLAQIMACRCEKARFGDARQFRLSLSGARALLPCPAVRLRLRR